MAPQSSTRPVVVGYDGSRPSEAALQWAARAAAHSKRRLVVLHAAERVNYPEEVSSGLEKAPEVVSEAKQIADHGAKNIAANFPELDVETSGSLLSAKVALGEASRQAAMVVVGDRGRGRVRMLLLGSTAYALAGYSRCPVVVVRDGDTDFPGPNRPVLVGVNGTGGSDRAVDAAAGPAREWDAPLALATTWNPPEPDPWERGPAGYRSVTEVSAALQATAERINDEALERVRSANQDLQVRGSVIQDHAVDGLAQAAEEAGLLVMGTRGHGNLVGAILGSTTLGVLQQATVPVMTVD